MQAGILFPLLLALGCSGAFACVRFLRRWRARQRMARSRTYARPWKFYCNWMRANLEMLFRVRNVHARPLEITVDSSNICQLACPVCITGTRQHDRPLGKANRELIDRLLAENGDYLLTLNFFNWGEPLLHSEMVFAWIAAAHDKGIRTRISSNLSLPLTEEQIERICSCGLHTLVVSLDGACSATYSRYRVKGDFERVLSNLRRILAARQRLNATGPHIVWQFLVFAHNEHEIEQARALAEQLGVDEIWFSAPQVKEAAGILPASDPRYHSGLSRIHREDFAQMRLAENRRRCVWHYMMTAINWDGALTPCCVLYKTADDFGSIGAHGERPLAAAYNMPRYQAVRAGVEKRKPGDPMEVCFHCPAPELQSARGINREVLTHCKQRILERLRNGLG